MQCLGHRAAEQTNTWRFDKAYHLGEELFEIHPTEPHWHLGPVAVDPHLQGQGIGGAMLAAFCARMEDCRTLSYLETDKCENVRFYQKFGFSVIAEAEVLGVPNWFMSRPPRKT